MSRRHLVDILLDCGYTRETIDHTIDIDNLVILSMQWPMIPDDDLPRLASDPWTHELMRAAARHALESAT